MDIKAVYNKLPDDNFYGLVPESPEDDLTHFIYERKELKLTLGRGFSSFLVCQVSYHLRNIRYYGVEENKTHTEKLESVGDQFSPFLSLLVRFDTSDSQIHPTRGIRLELQNDLAELETQYGLSSDEFYRRYQAGQTDDRMDYVEWASLVQMRDNLHERLRILTSEAQTAS